MATDSDWLYHSELGWIFLAPDADSSGAWLWMADQGWLWTLEDSFPWLYRNEDRTWIYFLKTKGGKAHFLNHSTGEVE